MSDEQHAWNRGVRGTQVLSLINDDAPVMRVEAGPGAGKTFGLGRRLQRLVSVDGGGIDPERILVVAFNRVIATDLRGSVEALFSASGVVGRPEISTVHGLCRRQIGGGAVRLLLDHEREMMLYDIAVQDPDTAAAYPSFHKRAQALRDHEAKLARHDRLWQVCQRWLTKHQAHLVGDLPSELLDRIEDGDHEDLRFDYVVVDEFQDLSATEQRLVAQLRSGEGQLLALGDPRQSIYAFRGNHRLGLRALESLTGSEVHDVTITECQRCPAQVVHAANALTRLDPSPPMIPASDNEARILALRWRSLEAEARGMADVIVQAVTERPNDRHLVMVTRRRFGYDLRAALRERDEGLPVHLDFSESVLEDWPAREAFLWFCLLSDPDPATWRAWFGHTAPDAEGGNFKPPSRHAPPYLRWLDSLERDIAEEDVLALAHAGPEALSGAGRTSMWDRAVRYRDLAAARDWRLLSAREAIEHCFDPDQWAAGGAETPHGYDVALLRGRALESLEGLPDGEAPTKRDESLREVAQELRYVIATREPLASTSDALAVHITTLWGAKGLTADHVYVVGLFDEALPGKRPPEYPGDDLAYEEEQRRLLYVTLTRCRESLVLSRATSASGRDVKSLNLAASSRYGRFRWSLNSSRFMREIRDFIPNALDGEALSGSIFEG